MLRAQVRGHQQAIDHFLAERENQLKLIGAMQSMEDLVAPGRLQAIFDILQQQMPGFIDLGVIDLQGNHRAYVGPFALLTQRYDQQEWFGKLIGQESYISDVYLGHRQAPHFIMAIKQGQGDRAYILRATVDSDFFDALVARGPGEFNADTFIVNRDGLFQTRSQTTGSLLASSGIQPDPDLKGIDLVSREDLLMLTLWQEKVPWLNVVQIKRNDIYGGIRRARLAVFFTFVVGAFLIAATILLTTGNLVRLLEAKGQDLRVLDKQLRRTSFLSSSMELSMGFFEKVKDILSNIDISVQWLSGHAPGDNEPESKETVNQIALEASRGHQLIDKFMMFVRYEDPIITDVQVHELLNDLLSFLEKELQRRHIDVARDYHKALTPLRSDWGKLRQVFQNLILNAMAALNQGGKIRLITKATEDGIMVIVNDNGPGIPAADHEKIFEPLFTTKPQGTGLGLPICRTILDQIGGTITLDTRPGQGASFTVKLPNRINALG